MSSVNGFLSDKQPEQTQGYMLTAQNKMMSNPDNNQIGSNPQS